MKRSFCKYIRYYHSHLSSFQYPILCNAILLAFAICHLLCAKAPAPLGELFMDHSASCSRPSKELTSKSNKEGFTLWFFHSAIENGPFSSLIYLQRISKNGGFPYFELVIDLIRFGNPSNFVSSFANAQVAGN